MRQEECVSVWLHIYFCIYIYMYIYLYTSMCIHAHPPILYTYICIFTYTWICVYTHTHPYWSEEVCWMRQEEHVNLWLHICFCMYIYTCIYTYTCTYICVCIHVHAYMYTRTQIYTDQEYAAFVKSNMWVCGCMSLCVYKNMYIHMYICIYTLELIQIIRGVWNAWGVTCECMAPCSFMCNIFSYSCVFHAYVYICVNTHTNT